jgi:hypothetical protein
LLQRRNNKKVYKLPYMEDFEANVEVSEEKNFVPAEMYKVGV